MTDDPSTAGRPNYFPMKTKLLASVFAMLLLASFVGCATPAATPTATPRRSQAVLNASKDKVWPLLVAEVAMNYPPQVMEKESGLIATQFVSINAGAFNRQQTNYILPPGGFLATYNALRMSMRVMAVETEPGKTMVSINCHYEAFENNVSKSWVVARSNGAIEDGILSRIEQQLPAQAKAEGISSINP